MVFQWYLFPLLLFVAWFAKAAGQTYTVDVNGRTERRYGWTPVLMIVLPLIILAGTRENIGDTWAYRASFLSGYESIFDAVSSQGKDKGFTVFTYFLKRLTSGNDILYFLIIATICLMCVAIIYKKYSCNFAVSMFLFVASSDYLQWNYNGMRQFIAVAVIFAATDLLLERKYFKYYILILLMSTIHMSALIMIPVSLFVVGKPWNTKTVLFIVSVFIAINFSEGLQQLIVEFMSETQYKGEINQYLETKGTNIFRVLVFCIPPVMALLSKRFLLAVNSPIINLSANMSVISMGTYIVSAVTSGIFIGRIPIYFSLYNYILLPWVVEKMFDKWTQKLVYGCIIVCYLAFYWYQMTVAWDFSAFI